MLLGAANSLSASRLTELGGENSRRTPTNPSFVLKGPRKKHPRTLLSPLLNLFHWLRKIFPSPSLSGVRRKSVFSKSHAWSLMYPCLQTQVPAHNQNLLTKKANPGPVCTP